MSLVTNTKRERRKKTRHYIFFKIKVQNYQKKIIN